nr:MAG TPA: hypothetical protein [Bacteriophage sp.]
MLFDFSHIRFCMILKHLKKTSYIATINHLCKVKSRP